MSPTRRAFGGIRKLPSGYHQAYYTGPDKARHTSWTTYATRGTAERWLEDERRLVEDGIWTPPKRRDPYADNTMPTFTDYAAANIRRRHTRPRKPIRESTSVLYTQLLRLAILPKLGGYRLSELTPTVIRAWYDALPEDAATQNGNAYALLRSLLNDAIDEELIPGPNPCRVKGAGRPAPKHVPQVLNPGQLAVYAAHVGRYTVPLLLAAWCGLRSGEVRGLRRCDVATDGSILRVEQAVSRIGEGDGRRWIIGPPKTAAGRRTVAIPPHLAPLVSAWLDEWDERHDDPDGLLVTLPGRTTPLNDTTLREAHKQGARAVGKPDLTVHDLRRTGATLAAQSGATLKEVMGMLGHTQPGVAMLYQVADADRDRERAARMSRLAIES